MVLDMRGNVTQTNSLCYKERHNISEMVLEINGIHSLRNLKNSSLNSVGQSSKKKCPDIPDGL